MYHQRETASSRGVERSLVRFWLAGAAVVTMARLLHAAQPGGDQGFQIVAAHNLLAGLGLSVYAHPGPDLADPASLYKLTHFPAGYSLIAVAAFAAGLGVGALIKLLGAGATMLGWWGWARLAQPFLVGGAERGRVWSWAAVVIAVITPVLFTDTWSGTDIFLWASVPWVLEWLRRGADENVRRHRSYDILAGALCGFALLMRYASLFLVAYAAAVIIWQARWRPPLIVRRSLALAMGLLPAVIVQVYFSYFAANEAVSTGHSYWSAPGGLTFNMTVQAAAERFLYGVTLLGVANYTWAFWVPGRFQTLLVPGVPVGSWQLAVVALCALALVWTFGRFYVESRNPARDSRLLALGLFAAVPITLLLAMTFGRYDYVSDRRYYYTLIPLSVLAAYSVAFGRVGRGLVPRIAQIGCGLYTGGYVLLAVAYVCLLLTPTPIGRTQRQKLIASELAPWPSTAVTYELSEARQFVMQLLREEPNTLLLTSRLLAFNWDPEVDQSRVHTMGCRSLDATRVTGPLRIVMHTVDQGHPEQLWYYDGTESGGTMRPATCFDGLSNVRLLRRFPNEGFKVLESRVATGEEISLGPRR